MVDRISQVGFVKETVYKSHITINIKRLTLTPQIEFV